MKSKLGKNFYIIFLSSIFVSCSTAVYGAILFFSLWYHSSSALLSSLVYLPSYIILTFLSPLIGYHVDKYDKRKLGFITIVLSLVLVSSLLILQHIFLMYIIYFLLMVLEYYFIINYKVSVKIIVNKEKLIYANALYLSGEGLSNLVGFIVGSYIYSFVSVNIFLFLLLLLYFFACILWIQVKINNKPKEKTSNKKIIKEIRDQYKEIILYLNSNKSLLNLIVLYDLIVGIIMVMVAPAYISYCFNYLKMMPIVYGLYYGFTSIINIIAPILISKFIKSKNVLNYAIVSLLEVGIVTIVIAFIPLIAHNNVYKLIIFILLISILSFPIALQYSSFSTIFQQIVPTEILGRFYSVRSIIRGLVSITFLLFAGYATDAVGPLPILYISGIGSILVAYPIKRILTHIKNETSIG